MKEKKEHKCFICLCQESAKVRCPQKQKRKKWKRGSEKVWKLEICDSRVVARQKCVNDKRDGGWCFWMIFFLNVVNDLEKESSEREREGFVGICIVIINGYYWTKWRQSAWNGKSGLFCL